MDVANPIAGGYEVVQIKSFTGELTASRKKKIEKSLEQAKAGGELDAPIKQWRLLMPMDRSKEADVWWKALIKDARFDCLWWGKTHMDKLAAEQPHVIDYYLRGGAARVEERFRDLLRTKDLIEFAKTGPQPAEIRRPLLDLLEALNREDPNYRYSFEAGFEPSPPMLERARPGLVMSVTEHAPDRGYVTIRVTARHRYAGEERPVTISFQADPGGDAHAALTRAFRYGATADLPIGSVQNLKLDAPGGLSTNADTAGLRLTPLSDPTFTPFQMRLAVRDDLGDELGAVVLNAVDRRPHAWRPARPRGGRWHVRGHR